ncbi:3-phosphoshikimate 1-carboxyvinyltransferase [Nocardioides salsibiostraticola]
MTNDTWWPAPSATRPIDAVVQLPGSKSLTNRALILAALAQGPSTVRRALRSRDTELMAQALRALGASVDTTGADWAVTPGSVPDSSTGSAVAIDCGLAGTVMRFVPPVAALTARSVHFDGDPHMRTRPIGVVLDALRALGADVEDTTSTLPFTVHGSGSVPGGTVSLDASASSQFVSALLLAGARFENGVDIRHDGRPVPSQPHLDMTISMLREHGVTVDDSRPNRWTVQPGPIAALDRAIEPDLSNAAPFLGLAAISGGTVTVRDWPEHTTQAGDALREILSQMGCTVIHTSDGLTVTGPEHLLGVDLDLHDVGELAPAVAALCAAASTPSRLYGIEHIRGHETDRLAALATELGRRGADVVEATDGLTIHPAPLTAGPFHTYADHRMAHAAVLVGAAVPGVLVENVETTSKTFPGFAEAWAELFA